MLCKSYRRFQFTLRRLCLLWNVFCLRVKMDFRRASRGQAMSNSLYTRCTCRLKWVCWTKGRFLFITTDECESMKEWAFYWCFQEDNKKMSVENERGKDFSPKYKALKYDDFGPSINVHSTFFFLFWTYEFSHPKTGTLNTQFCVFEWIVVYMRRGWVFVCASKSSSQPIAAHTIFICTRTSFEIHDGCFQNESISISARYDTLIP